MDKIKPQSSFVKTNEILLKDDHDWLHFAEPHQIICAQKLEDVLPALRNIERLIQVNRWHAAGYISYEAAPAFDSAFHTSTFAQSQRETGFPYLWFGLYPRPRLITLLQPTQPRESLNWQPTINRQSYHSGITKIKDYIAQGKTYQVNYTMRLKTDFSGNPWDFFLHLVQSQNQYAGYIETGRWVICSASPELFFRLEDNQITCQPMKGTVKRGRTAAEDIEHAHRLRTSDKNRAENVMIVDMIRNDLGRIAEFGSVRVLELFETHRYPTLWQMTSTLTAKTRAPLTEIFSALFPCASITGAPKVSATRIIAELENTPRKIYTGSIGYISPKRKATFNVAIRTALIDRQTEKAEYGTGGGIVWDSTSADEYSEALLKARVLTEPTAQFSLLETILWTPEGGFSLREKHLARMLDSANYFDIPISEIELEECLEQISSKFSSPQRVRLLLDQSGKLSSEAGPFQLLEEPQFLKVCLAKEPIDSNNIFLFHKTTQRTVYESARKELESFDDVLLYNELGELTEFRLGNLVVELNNKLITPPVSCGLLRGTFRAHLLETGKVAERKILVEQLKDCTKIFRVNSVRKWQKVEIQIRHAGLKP
jgi:para-aminobenzoate synthetase/4-amino-4-deoxychorismate lyase